MILQDQIRYSISIFLDKLENRFYLVKFHSEAAIIRKDRVISILTPPQTSFQQSAAKSSSNQLPGPLKVKITDAHHSKVAVSSVYDVIKKQQLQREEIRSR